MTIEGFFAGTNSGEENDTMASVLNGFMDDLQDTRAYMRMGKAALGGNVGLVVAAQIAKRLPTPAKMEAKTAGALKAGATGVLGIVLGVLTERYLGEAAACGFVGGASGSALVALEKSYLPASITAELGSGSLGEDGSALTYEERAFLNGFGAQDVNAEGYALAEVGVEDTYSLGEVGVEDVNPTLAALYG